MKILIILCPMLETEIRSCFDHVYWNGREMEFYIFFRNLSYMNIGMSQALFSPFLELGVCIYVLYIESKSALCVVCVVIMLSLMVMLFHVIVVFVLHQPCIIRNLS